LVDAAAQIFGLSGRGPAAVLVAVRADLGHDVQRFGVWMQRFTDQLVGDGRPVGIAGVDVGDAEVDGLAQDGDCAVAVGAEMFRWSIATTWPSPRPWWVARWSMNPALSPTVSARKCTRARS
jgi:hypothetical protein